MRNAPSVIHPVGRPFFLGLVLVCLALAALAVIAVWVLTPVEAQRGRPVLVAALVACALWGAWAAVGWWRSPEGRLEWRGRGTHAAGVAGGWFWHGAAPQPRPLHRVPEVVLDLQRAVLVRLDDQWIWLEARHGATSWWGLRRALLASAPV